MVAPIVYNKHQSSKGILFFSLITLIALFFKTMSGNENVNIAKYPGAGGTGESSDILDGHNVKRISCRPIYNVMSM